MRILIINSDWPSSQHNAYGASIILYELVVEFARQPGLDVGFLRISRHGESGNENPAELEDKGVKVLPSLELPPNLPRRPIWKRILRPKLIDFYPEVAHRYLAEEKIMEFAPDVILISMNEWVTTLCANVKTLKFGYYGNPDSKSGLARILFSYRHGDISVLRFLAMKRSMRHLERLHLREMRKYEILPNVAVNDAQYYTDKGHPNAIYFPNLWIDRFGESWREKRRALGELPVIIASIGNVNATANIHGLEILGNEVLPELKKWMKDKDYEVHILGGGELRPDLKEKLQGPEVKIRGFVKDIDQEMLRAKVFLCLNNASSYKVTHARYLEAWSMGCCVVAHQDVTLSIPEMIHGKNILLGRNSVEIAKLVNEAFSDQELRRRVGEGGYQTLKEYFVADKVVPKMLEMIRAYPNFLREKDYGIKKTSPFATGGGFI